MIEGFENETRKLGKLEKKWMSYLFKTFYRNFGVRKKANHWIKKAYSEIENWENRNCGEMPKGSAIRKIVYFIRNTIIAGKARVVLNTSNMDNLPSSYKRLFWIDASNMGYMATQDKEEIEKHIKSLKEREECIKEDIVSAYEVLEAIKKLEKHGMLVGEEKVTQKTWYEGYGEGE